MNKNIYLNTARLSATGLLALMIAACGSDNNSTPVTASSSSTTATSSSATASSDMSSMSSSSVAAPMTTAISLNFDNMSPGAVPSGFNLTGTGVAVVEGEGAYSGDLALKVSGAGASYLSLADFTGTHWGRMYYKNTVKPTAIANYSHTTLVSGIDGDAHFRFVDMVAAPDSAPDAGKYQHLYNTEPNDLSLEGSYTNSYDGEWVCIEWSVDTTEQEFHLFKDGTEITLANRGTESNSTDLTTAKNYASDDELPMTPISTVIPELRIGIQNYQGDEFTFLLDDIVVADARVGCEVANANSSSSAMSSEMSSAMSSEMSSESSSSAPSGPTQAEIDARVAAGKALYDDAAKSCVACHGANGEGGFSKAINNTALSYDEIDAIITNGAAGMPACTSPSDCGAQIADYMWVEFLGKTLTADGGE